MNITQISWKFHKYHENHENGLFSIAKMKTTQQKLGKIYQQNAETESDVIRKSIKAE